LDDEELFAKRIIDTLMDKQKKVPETWLEQFKADTVTQQYLDVIGL